VKSIFFKDQGKGIPIVLIHGFCETHQIWDGFSDELAKDFRVLTPDLPGFGQSPLPAKVSIEAIANQIADWVHKLQIAKPIVIGHSLGGYVTLAMAKRNPLGFSGIGLMNSTAFADSEEKKANRTKTIEFVRQNGVAPFIETFVAGLFNQKDHSAFPFVKQMALATPPETVIAYTEAMRERPSYEDFLKNFPGFVLILAGTHDSIIPLPMSEKAADLAPHTMFHILQNSGHMGMIESRPDSLKSIRQFAGAYIQ
jgi:pimeloyl-ACP methyl ester carboxylesterase